MCSQARESLMVSKGWAEVATAAGRIFGVGKIKWEQSNPYIGIPQSAEYIPGLY